MATSFSQRFEKIRKEQEEAKKNSSKKQTTTNKSSFADRFKKINLENTIDFDTFEADLNSMGTTIQGIYDGWQTQDTMSKTKTTVEAMQARINAYQDYQKMFGGADLSELANSYKSVLDNWDNVSTMYSQYKDADSFNVAKKNAMFDEQFKGLSYKDVQSKLKEYATDSDEYKYLSGYTNYSDLNDFDEALKNATGDYKSKLQKIRNQYALDNKFDLYKGYTEAEDFGEKSQYWDGHSWATDNFTSARSAAAKDHSIVYDKKSKTYYVYSDPLYEYVNDKNNARKNLTQGVMKGDYSKLGLEYSNKGYDKLTDEEIAVFNYIDATEGHDKAVEYLEEMSTTLTKRKYDKQTQDWNKAVDSGVLADIGLSVATVPANIVGALGNAFATVDEFIKGEEYNPYHRYRMVGNFATDTRGYISENIAEATEGVELFGQNVPSFLYDTGMSIGDTALGTLTTGKLYSVFAGTNAYQQKAKELVEAGEDESKVFYTALASGAAEMVFEYLSIDKLLKIKNVDSAASLIKNTLKQAGVEGSEELFTEIANIVSDSAIRGKSSELYQMYEDLKSKGYSTKEINTEIAKQVGGQIGWSFTGGALSGGVMGGGASAKSYSEMSSLGKGIKGNERTSDMLDIAGLTPQESEAYKAYTSYANKGINADNISNARLGNLYATTDEGARKTLSSKKSTLEQKRGATETLKKLSVVDEQNTVSKDTINQIDRNIGIREAYMESADELIATGLESGKDTKSYKLATEYKQKLDNGIELTEKEIANLVKANSEAITAEDVATLSEEDAALFKSVYDGKTDKSDFFHSFELVKTLTENNYSADYILEHKGVLSAKQVSAIYKAKVLSSDASLEKAITALKEKHEGTAFIEGTFDDSVINYDNTNVEGKVNWNSLNSNQKKAIAVLGQVGKRAGMDVELISDGLERGINGAFEISGNKMLIDIYAGMDKVDGSKLQDTIIPTTSHEMTHWMKSKSPTLYRKYDNYVFGTLTMSGKSESDILSARRQKMEKAHPGEKFTDAEVRDEVIARASEDMFAKSEEIKNFLNTLTDSEKKSFVEKVKEILQNVKEWLNDFLSKQKSTSDEAKIIRQYADRIDGQIELWDKMLISSISANQALKKEGITGEELAKSANKDVKHSHRDVEKGKKRYYNELNSLAMQWAYSASTNVGDTKIFNDRGKSFLVLEATEDGYIEIARGSYEEVKEFEQLYKAENEGFDRYAETYESLEGTSNSGLWKSPNREMFGRNSRTTNPTQEGIEGNTSTGNAEYVLSDNKKTSAEIKRSDRDTDTFSYIQTLQRAVNELRDILTEMQNSEDFKVAHDKLSEAISNGDVKKGIKIYQEWQEKSGYAELSQRRDTLQLELDNLRKSFNEEIANKALNEEKEAIAKSGLSEADYFRKQAVKEFGYTPYFYDAGYITPNGKMLNFSGEKGKHYGTRGQDHRAIGIIYAETSGTDALNRFMKDGNVRIMAESPGIDISTLVEPTTEQYSTIKKFIYEYANKEYFNVDLTDENGNVIGSLEYENKINPSRIINDIKHYYATGEIREQSNIDKFRYSDRDTLGNTLTEAQQSYFAESKVRDENGNLKVMYHGTPNATFTKFRSGTYFTEHKWYADNYQNQGASSLSYKKTADNPDTYAVYLNIKKPFDTRNKKERDIFYKEYYQQWGTGTDLMESGLPDWLDGQDLQEFLEENGYDYDGLILDEGGMGGYGDEVINRGLSYVVFSPEQVKSVENKTPTNDPDYRFSDREINKNLNLIAVHGTREEKLLKALKLEGLPGLSTAVINIDDGLANEDYGEISLVFDKHTIDPTLKGNAVYGADIWSPTQSDAQVERQTSSKGIRQFESKISDLAKNVVGGTFAGSVNLGGILYTGSDSTTLTLEDLSYRFDRNDTVMAAYLASQGKDIEPIMKPKMYHSRFDNETLAYVLSKFQDDEYSPLSDEMLDIYVHSRDYEMTEAETQKMASIFKELMLKSGMREDLAERLVKNRYAKDNNEETYKLLDAALRYDQDGRPNEETIDRLATSNAMEEIVSKDWDSYRKWIAEEITDAGVFTGEEGLFNKTDRVTDSGRKTFKQSHIPITAANIVRLMNKEENRGVGYYGFGVEGIQSLTATKYSNIESIRADKGRLKKLDSDEYNAIISNYNQKLANLVKEIAEYSDVRLDTVSEAFKDAAKGARTTSSIRKAYSFYDIKISDELIKESQKLYNEVGQIPSKYFEAKASRVVGFNEIRKAVIPDSSSKELVDALEEKGIPYTTYKYGDNEERLEIIRSLDDVKFSDRDNVSVYDTMGETDRLIKENTQLREDVERLKERLKLERQITNGNHFNENQLNAVAAHIRNIAKSSYSKPELVNLLKGVYSYIATSKDLNWQDMFAQCYDIASMVLNEARPVTETNEYYKWILNDIRGTKISVNEQQIQNARYKLGNRWRNAFFNKVKITDNAISLDRQWQEWSNAYPDLFDAEISDADQLVELYDIYDSVREGSELVVEYDTEEQTRWLAREIYNQYWNVSPIRTTAEKYTKQIKLLNYKHRESMNQLRSNYEDRLKTQHKADRQKAIKLVKEIRERKDKEIAAVKKHSKERMDAYKENAERKTKIQSITTNALTLNKWLTTNSKDYHIHEALKEPVMKLLQSIDFSSKRMLEKNIPTQKDVSFTEAFASVKDMLTKADNMVAGLEELYGHDLAEDIERLVQATYSLIGDNNYVINKMSVEELKSLDRLVKYIKKVVTDLNKFHTVHHNQGAINLANEFVGYGDKLGKLKKQDGKIGKFLKFRNCTPYYFFKRLGGAGNKLFEAFQDGWDKLAFNVKEIIDFTEKTYTTKEVREWSKETKDFTITQKDGKKRSFKMSIAQIMALHCVSKQEDAMRHLLSKGMTLSRVDKKGNVIAEYENITLTMDEINTIIGTLDNIPRAKEVADKLQEFMNTICSDWGNAISMARFGIKMFTNPNYFPIKVSPSQIPTDNTKELGAASLFRLLNMSFTKARNKFADQSIEIGDIFDIFAQHTTDMAKYNALALPVLDFNKFYSYTYADNAGNEYGVENTLRTVFGDESVGYIKRFIRDINGTENVSRDVIGKTFFKNAKLAAVANNLRVILLQPTAYVKASTVMDNKYLLKAKAYVKVNPVTLYGKLKKAIEKAENHCGIIQWKALGYYDTDISKGIAEKVKHADTFWDKAKEKSMMGAEIADKATFGTLWIACEFEVRDTHKDLKVGSEEFYQAVAKRLREIVYSTQVVDSTMTRSDMMRSADGLDKMFTTFGSEPIIAYNMLMDAAVQYNLDKKTFGKNEARKKNGKKIRKTITAYVMVNALAALVESGFDVYRDDEDEEIDIAEFMKLYFKNFALDLSIGNKLPIVKELYSIMQGYSSSRMDTQWMEYIYKLVKTDNVEKGIKYSLRLVSDLSGIAFYNAYRDIMATLYKLDILSSEDIEEIFE